MKRSDGSEVSEGEHGALGRLVGIHGRPGVAVTARDSGIRTARSLCDVNAVLCIRWKLHRCQTISRDLSSLGFADLLRCRLRN